MIEVLTAMSITTIVLLSLLSYQIGLVKEAAYLNMQSIAQMQLMNATQILIANQTSRNRRAAWNQWNKDNATVLPQGQGSDNAIDTHLCVVTLNWFYYHARSESITTVC